MKKLSSDFLWSRIPVWDENITQSLLQQTPAFETFSRLGCLKEKGSTRKKGTPRRRLIFWPMWIWKGTNKTSSSSSSTWTCHIFPPSQPKTHIQQGEELGHGSSWCYCSSVVDGVVVVFPTTIPELANSICTTKNHSSDRGRSKLDRRDESEWG